MNQIEINIMAAIVLSPIALLAVLCVSVDIIEIFKKNKKENK